MTLSVLLGSSPVDFVSPIIVKIFPLKKFYFHMKKENYYILNWFYFISNLSNMELHSLNLTEILSIFLTFQLKMTEVKVESGSSI